MDTDQPACGSRLNHVLTQDSRLKTEVPSRQSRTTCSTILRKLRLPNRNRQRHPHSNSHQSERPRNSKTIIVTLSSFLRNQWTDIGSPHWHNEHNEHNDTPFTLTDTSTPDDQSACHLPMSASPHHRAHDPPIISLRLQTAEQYLPPPALCSPCSAILTSNTQ